MEDYDFEQEQDDLELVECWMFVMAVLIVGGSLALAGCRLGLI